MREREREQRKNRLHLGEQVISDVKCKRAEKEEEEEEAAGSGPVSFIGRRVDAHLYLFAPSDRANGDLWVLRETRDHRSGDRSQW